PATGCRAEVNDLHTRLQDLVLVVDLDQLVGCARAHALGICAVHIGVVQVTLEPATRRVLQLGLFDPGLELPQSAGFLVFHVTLAAAWNRLRRQAPSRAIISLSMPSRSPRSATRSRSAGHCLRIASRIAHPASTRSARSSPMHGLARRWSKLQPRICS